MTKERSVLFGGHVKLAGVVTEANGSASERPACILLNAGVVHRVGPNRLYVRLARDLASAGHLVMRFDFSGRGDSDVRTDGLSFIESSVAETKEAMDYLAGTRHARRFVLLGICSGAGNAFQTALADSRVAGAVMIDVHAYPTAGYYLRYYARRIGSIESWRNTLSGRNGVGRTLRRVLNRGGLTTGTDETGQLGEGPGRPSDQGLVPPKPQAEKALREVIGRGVRLLLIYSGTWRAFNYQNQFRDAFPALCRSGMIRVEYFPDADHTFSRLYNQQRLVETIRTWVATNWPAQEHAVQPVPSEQLQTRPL